jgi:hypothetical protein
MGAAPAYPQALTTTTTTTISTSTSTQSFNYINPNAPLRTMPLNPAPPGHPPRSAGNASLESEGSVVGEDTGEYTTALPDMAIKDKSSKEKKGGFRGVLPFRGKKDKKDRKDSYKKDKERKDKGKEKERRDENRSPERGGSSLGRYDEGKGRGEKDRDEEF